MSKEKKFHQLIEEQNQEGKARAWEKLQTKMGQTVQSAPTIVEKPAPNFKSKWGWGKIAAVAGATAAVICLSVFAAVKFLPYGGITADQSSSETSLVETSENDSQNGNRYCTAEQYTYSAITKTVKQYSQETGKDLLYFDWYDTTEEVTNSVYTLNDTNEIIRYRENIINPETGDVLTFYVSEKNIEMDFLQWEDGATENVYLHNQVDITWDFGLTQAQASFEYGGYRYNIELVDPLEEDDILEYAKLLLG